MDLGEHGARSQCVIGGSGIVEPAPRSGAASASAPALAAARSSSERRSSANPPSSAARAASTVGMSDPGSATPSARSPTAVAQNPLPTPTRRSGTTFEPFARRIRRRMPCAGVVRALGATGAPRRWRLAPPPAPGGNARRRRRRLRRRDGAASASSGATSPASAPDSNISSATTSARVAPGVPRRTRTARARRESHRRQRVRRGGDARGDGELSHDPTRQPLGERLRRRAGNNGGESKRAVKRHAERRATGEFGVRPVVRSAPERIERGGGEAVLGLQRADGVRRDFFFRRRPARRRAPSARRPARRRRCAPFRLATHGGCGDEVREEVRGGARGSPRRRRVPARRCGVLFGRLRRRGGHHHASVAAATVAHDPKSVYVPPDIVNAVDAWPSTSSVARAASGGTHPSRDAIFRGFDVGVSARARLVRRTPPPPSAAAAAASCRLDRSPGLDHPRDQGVQTVHGRHRAVPRGHDGPKTKRFDPPRRRRRRRFGSAAGGGRRAPTMPLSGGRDRGGGGDDVARRAEGIPSRAHPPRVFGRGRRHHAKHARSRRRRTRRIRGRPIGSRGSRVWVRRSRAGSPAASACGYMLVATADEDDGMSRDTPRPPSPRPAECLAAAVSMSRAGAIAAGWRPTSRRYLSRGSNPMRNIDARGPRRARIPRAFVAPPICPRPPRPPRDPPRPRGRA